MTKQVAKSLVSISLLFCAPPSCPCDCLPGLQLEPSVFLRGFGGRLGAVNLV